MGKSFFFGSLAAGGLFIFRQRALFMCTYGQHSLKESVLKKKEGIKLGHGHVWGDGGSWRREEVVDIVVHCVYV